MPHAVISARGYYLYTYKWLIRRSGTTVEYGTARRQLDKKQWVTRKKDAGELGAKIQWVPVNCKFLDIRHLVIKNHQFAA